MSNGARTSLRSQAGPPWRGSPSPLALLLALFLAHDARQRAASAASLGSIEDLARLTSYIADVVHAVQDERAARSTTAGQGADGKWGGPSDAYGDTDAAAGRLEAFLAPRDRSKLPARLSGDLVQSGALLREFLGPSRTAPSGAPVRLQDLSARCRRDDAAPGSTPSRRSRS